MEPSVAFITHDIRSTCSAISSSHWPHLECFVLSSETLAFARFGGIERSEVDLSNSRSYLISLSQQLGTTIGSGWQY